MKIHRKGDKPMQVTETEIILPIAASTSMQFSSRRSMISSCIWGILMLGGGIVLLLPQVGFIVAPGDVALPIILISFGVLGFLLLFAEIFMMFARRRNHVRCVRINCEGFFFPTAIFSSKPPRAVRWSEISALVPHAWNFLRTSRPTLSIIPRDSEAMIDRVIAEQSKGFFSHLLAKLNMWMLYRCYHALSLFNIIQGTVPISIDELITLIQECFAGELREHHVEIEEWQD